MKSTFASNIRHLLCLIALAIVLAAPPAWSAVRVAQAHCVDTVISIVTIHPGADIYELEGHTALRIATPQYDVAINYGTFDFNAPNFVYRFVKGETDYCVAAAPWDLFRDYYIQSGRRVVEQCLDLTPQEASKLIELIAENLQPENATYRYNYVKDNCATRPLMMVNRAIAPASIVLGSMEDGLGDPADPHAGSITFRESMTYFHRNYPWYQFGIDLALGSGIDYPITNDEKIYAPVILEQMLGSATRSSDNNPIVYESVTVYDVSPTNAVVPPTPLWLHPVTVFALLLLLSCVVAGYGIKRGRPIRWYYALIFSALGLLGLVLTFLIFVSSHEATSPNYLYIFFNPLCLAVPVLIFIKRAGKVLGIYFMLNTLAVAGGLIAWPFLPQQMNIAALLIILTDLILSLSYIYISRKK